MTLFWYIAPSLAPRALLYLPSKRELHIAMGMTQNLTLLGTNVKRTHKGEKIIIKSQKCGSRRLPKRN